MNYGREAAGCPVFGPMGTEAFAIPDRQNRGSPFARVSPKASNRKAPRTRSN